MRKGLLVGDPEDAVGNLAWINVCFAKAALHVEGKVDGNWVRP